MKKMLAMTGVLIFAMTALAYSQEGLKLGYVDIRKVMSDSKAGKSAKELLDKDIKAKQVRVDNEKKKLESMKEDFDKKASDLSENEKKKRQNEFQEKLQEYQKMLADAQKEVKEIESDHTKKIFINMKKAIAEIAQAENITMIFEKTDMSVLYSKDGLDLTGKVIERMDVIK